MMAATMQLPRRTLLTTAALTPLAHVPLTVRADTSAVSVVSDWDVPDGHFYTQTAPRGAAADAGFLVSNGGGLNFWNDFKALGGPAQLGFPVSDRWEAD